MRKKLNQIKSLKRKGVSKTLVIKSARQSGGSWYKIRVGAFDKKSEAIQIAKRLMDDKLIKNYFVVSKPKRTPDKKDG